MRRLAAAVVVLLLAGAIVFFFSRSQDTAPEKSAPSPIPETPVIPSAPTTQTPPRSPTLPPPERAIPATIVAGNIRLLPGITDLSANLDDPSQSPEHDLEVVNALVGEYRRIFAQNPPGGLNVEITAALAGANSKRLAMLPPDSAALNGEGELIDRWGTPFYFHPVSPTDLEVLSAGPDGQLWTPDDLGTFTPANAEILRE